MASDYEDAIVGKLRELAPSDALALINDELKRKPAESEFLKALRAFVQMGIRPSNLQPWQVPKLKWLAAQWVERGFLKADILQLF